jgi:hypothetical protein
MLAFASEEEVAMLAILPCSSTSRFANVHANEYFSYRQISRGTLMAIDSLERMERLLAIAQNEGIRVRSEWLNGVRGGLVRIGSEPILFIDDSLDLQEQLRQASEALSQLDWRDSEWWDELQQLLDSVGTSSLRNAG